MAGCVTHLHDADDGEGGVGGDGLAGQRRQISAKLEEGVGEGKREEGMRGCDGTTRGSLRAWQAVTSPARLTQTRLL